MKFTLYSDPGHAWLKVPRALLIKLNIQSYITSYSRMRGDYVYIEEDCDYATFQRAMQKNGETIEYKKTYSDKQSKIIGYHSYFNYSEEELKEIKTLRDFLLNKDINWHKSTKTRIKNTTLEDLKFIKEYSEKKGLL